MFKSIQNLRIGTKLAVTSVLSILLVVGMIYAKMTGNAAVRQADESAGGQHAITMHALEAKAALGGMMIGVREIRLSGNPAELQTAEEYLATRHKAAENFIDETFKLSKSAENRARIEKMKALADDYVKSTGQPIIDLQKEVVT